MEYPYRLLDYPHLAKLLELMSLDNYGQEGRFSEVIENGKLRVEVLKKLETSAEKFSDPDKEVFAAGESSEVAALIARYGKGAQYLSDFLNDVFDGPENWELNWDV